MRLILIQLSKLIKGYNIFGLSIIIRLSLIILRKDFKLKLINYQMLFYVNLINKI